MGNSPEVPQYKKIFFRRTPSPFFSKKVPTGELLLTTRTSWTPVVGHSSQKALTKPADGIIALGHTIAFRFRNITVSGVRNPKIEIAT